MRQSDEQPRRSGPENRVGYQYTREMAWVAVVCSPLVIGAAWTLGTNIISSYNGLLAALAEHNTRLAVHDQRAATRAADEAAQQLRLVAAEQAVREVERKQNELSLKLESHVGGDRHIYRRLEVVEERVEKLRESK